MNLFSKPNFQLVFVALLAIVFGVQIYILQLAHLPNSIIWAEVFISAISISFICYLQSNLLLYYTPQQSRQFIVVLWSVVFAAAWVFILWGGMQLYSKENVMYLSFLKSTLLIRTLIAWMFICAIGFYNLLWQGQQLALQTQRMQLEIKEMANDAELYKLRQQMQPHFLFNSLNSINAFITANPAQARKMVQQLSDYLRATLSTEEKEMSTLEKEMSYVQLYLDIEKVRFGHRLSTVFNVPENLLAKPIPHLVLQPVLENAIKFGLYNTLEKVEIIVKASLEEGMLCITVSNPFDASSNSSNPKGTGFGLKAIQKRLQLIYGTYTAVQLSKNATQFFTTINIPQL
jgi:two-component system, LytTR family, sensor kinase